MFYESLFNPSIHRPVKACLTGAGEFGASFLFQAQGMPLLEVPAVCTRTVQRAVDAYENAGIPASKVRVCESAEDAKKAYADGFNVVVDSFECIADLPLDVLVESSGAPEASAAAAELAIERGMHVVMVSKETDSVVGSILARKAAERGLVYTTGDGDQPSLLIGLISWGRVLGMNIVGAGKSSEYDFIYDPARDMVLCPGQKQEIATPGMGSLWQFGNRPAEEVVGKRRAMLTSLSHRSVPDLCEMAVVANATGMMPDRPLFHAPVARIDEMPDLFCPKADGGLFDRRGGDARADDHGAERLSRGVFIAGHARALGDGEPRLDRLLHGGFVVAGMALFAADADPVVEDVFGRRVEFPRYGEGREITHVAAPAAAQLVDDEPAPLGEIGRRELYHAERVGRPGIEVTRGQPHAPGADQRVDLVRVAVALLPAGAAGPE